MVERTSVSDRSRAAAQAAPAAEIGALLDRYLISLDDGTELDDDWAHGLFTEPARVEFPTSQHEGLVGIADYHRQSLAVFERTQHLNSPAVVGVAGDRAWLKANVMATHVHRAPAEVLFTAGTLMTGEARRAADGWRLCRLSFRVLWVSGRPPGPSAG